MNSAPATLDDVRPSTQRQPSSRPSSARPQTGRRLETRCRFDALDPLNDSLRSRVIGQDQALDRLVGSFSRLLSGLRDPSRPLLTALLLGPTGVGKTETARSIAYALFGSDKAMLQVNCEELAHSHEIAKLFGSPPGYVGQEIEPLLSQGRLDEAYLKRHGEEGASASASMAETISSHNEGRPIAIILFDEIEKAHPAVWSSLLGILEDGTLTLGDNSKTDFTHAIVLMTSNVGSREMGEMLDPQPLGFHAGASSAKDDSKLEDVAMGAARRQFPLEFLNRFDQTLVYRALDRDALAAIFKKFLDEIHQRTIHQARTPLLLKVQEAAADWILDRGSDPLLGARPLRRVMEREIVDPLSRLIVTRQLEAGDVVKIEREDDRLAFYRQGRESRKIVA